jgi:hypothetical protein
LVTGCPPFDGQDDKSIMDSVKKMQFTFESTYVAMQFLRLRIFQLRSRILSPRYS